MAKRKPKPVVYRRKRGQSTNYRKRLRLLIGGTSRLVVRITNTRIIAQIVEFQHHGDRIVVGTDSTALRKLGWKYSCKNIPAAYLTGALIASKARATGCNAVILDSGFRGEFKKGKLYAVVKGAVDAGLKIPHGEDIFPLEERMQGHHIQNYYGHKDKGTQQFAQYLKTSAAPEKIVQSVQELKSKIINS